MLIYNDIKYTLRGLSQKPGFSVLAILVMACGIGLSVYLFSFMNTMLFKPMPFEGGERFIQVFSSQNGSRYQGMLNLHDFHEIKQNLTGISASSAFRDQTVTISQQGGNRRVNATNSRANIFSFTQTQPILGRSFTEAEDRIGAPRVVVIGYELWQNMFAGQENILNQYLRIDNEQHQIIGVMPEDYFFPFDADLWRPLRDNVEQVSREEKAQVSGLLLRNEETSIEELDEQLKLIMQRLETRYPEANNGIGAYALSPKMTSADGGMAVAYTMHIAAVLILILASVNVGNLLLSRALERSHETAIRVALGAPRGRLISQLLWESIVICSLGGLIGLCMIGWGLEVTQVITNQFYTDRPPFWWQFGIDAYTVKLFFAFLLSTILITGLLPALKSVNGDFNAVLRDGTRGALGKNTGRLNKLLVVCEIFLSITILLIAAFIIIASKKATEADYGANVENVIVSRVQLPVNRYDTAEHKTAFVNSLKATLVDMPQFEHLIISSALPGISSIRPSIAVEGKEYDQQGRASYPRVNHIAVSAGSLKHLEVGLIEGRYFNHADDQPDKNTVIVTQSFVTQFMNTEQPVGKRVRVINDSTQTLQWATIVGVVEHTIQTQPNSPEATIPSIFQPYSQSPRNAFVIATRIGGSFTATEKTLRQAVQSIDPQLAIYHVELYRQTLDRYMAPLTFVSNVLGLFGLASFVLAGCGIYGVMSNTIGQRLQEVGVKRALGANERHIICEFLWASVKQLLWGLIPGLGIGIALGVAMSTILNVSLFELLSIASILTVGLAGVVFIATYIPTKRALDMEPSHALHYQ
jgi:predicted permease